MNKPYNVLVTLNNNLEKVHPYHTNKEVQAKRETLFDVIKNHNAVTQDKRLYRGYMPSSKYNYEGHAGNYTQVQAIEKINQLEGTVKNGWIYSFDTETLGQPSVFNSPNINSADKLNNDIFSITELAISKQQFKDGKPVGEITPVVNFTSSPNRKALEKYKFKALGDNSVANKTTLSTLTRIAGYSEPGNFGIDKTGKKIISGWNGSAKVNDDLVLGRAISLLTGDSSSGIDKGVQFIVGTEEYNEEVRRIFNIINEQILNSDNSMLNSMNGIMFDNPVLQEFFSRGGINLDNNFLEKLNNKTVDTQQLLRGTSKPKIIRLLNKAKVSVNMTVESLIHAANELGAGIKKSDSHVASNDAENSARILNAFLPDIFKTRDTILSDMNNKVPVSTKAIYHANSAVTADDNDIFFIDNGYDNPNVYNSVLMEPGHSYSIESYRFNKKNIPAELKDKIKDFKNKKVIKMEDMYEGYNRTAYLVMDKQASIQEKILDTGGVVTTTMNDETVDFINKSTEEAFVDKARRTRDNFYRINSDKGIQDFENYLESYNSYATKVENASKENLSVALKSGVIEGYEGNKIAIKDALDRLFTRGKEGQDGTLIHERAFNLVNMYSDLKNNYDLYSSMVQSANESVGSYESFLYGNNIKDSEYSRRLFNKTRTSALASIKQGLTNDIMGSLGDDEVLDYVIGNNEHLSKLVNSRINKNMGRNNTSLDGRTAGQIKREAYEDFFGEGFSKDSKHAQAYVLGKKELNGTLKDFEGIDIKNPSGEFSRIQINDKNNFTSSFRKMLYSGVKAENNIPQASDNRRMTYLRTVVNDLSDRGLVDSSVVEQFNSTDTVQGMVDIITNGIYDTKSRFDKLVTPGKSINYEKLSPEDFKFVRNYINNSKPNTIYSETNGFSVMGQSANDFVNSKISNVKEDFVELGRHSVPSFATYSQDGVKTSFGTEQMQNALKSEFGWSDSNIKNFMSKVINNEELSAFEYATSGKKVNGLSHTIMTGEGGVRYLVSTPFDKQQIIADKIARGANVGEINNLAVLWKIPKVEELGGVKVIKQGSSSYKAVTTDLVIRHGRLSDSNEWGSVLDVEDTVDQVVNNLGSKYGIVKSKKLMEQGSYKAASKNLNSSWTKINKNKTLSSITTRFKKGFKGVRDRIYKETTLNRADYALSGMVDISDMVYALDILETTKNEKLLKSFNADVGNHHDVLEEIKGVKSKLNGGNSKHSKKAFSEWETPFKLWFSDNISEIAKEIIANTSFAEIKPEAFDIINAIKDVGSEGFFGKESGDANRGYFFLNSPRNFVAGSSFSGTSRPLLNQVMSALNVFGDDMVGLAQRKLPKKMRKKIKSINDLEKSIGFRMGHGYMTEEAIKYSNIAKDLNGGEIGFTTKVKFMGSNEFLDKINNLINIDEEGFNKLISNGSDFYKGLSDTGVGIDIVRAEYIRRIAKNISTATNLYEDSSLVTPLLGQILHPKTVTSVKFDGDSSRFKIGDTLNAGDVLFKDKNKKNKKIKGKIVDIEGDKLLVQLNENYNNFKIGIGFEKSEAVTPVVNSIKKLRKGEEAAMAHALIRELSGGANIVTNPNIINHESLNTMLSGYFNSIGYELNDSNIDDINQSLKNHLSNANMEYIKNRNGRYVLSEGSKEGVVSLNDFDNFIDEIKSKNYKEIGSNINDLEKHGIFNADIVAMQDNTVENSQGSDNVGKGAAISTRSQSVMGASILDENIEGLSKHRVIKDGKMENLWQPLIDSDIEQLASDPKFILAQEQVQNIRVALGEATGNKIDGAKISKFSLDRGAVGSSMMTAEDIPQIFRYSNRGERIHAYEIDISDLNINIRNPEYDDLVRAGKTKLIKEKNIQEYARKIIIPALDPNYMDEEYILTKTQRAASDIINGLNDFRNGEFRDVSIQKASSVLSEQYKNFMGGLRYDLDSSGGLNDHSQKIKSKFSSRMKVSIVAAPVTRDGFVYKDVNFARTSTLKVGGKEKYYSSSFVHMEDFTNKGLTMETVGRQVISENIDDSIETLNILKKNLSGNAKIQNAKNMQEARKILNGSNLNQATYRNIGTQFLEEVGIYGRVMRDPAAKSTSYQETKIRIGNITQGTFSTDAVTSKHINADVDGDEINLFFDGIMSRINGKGISQAVLKSQDNIEVQRIKEIMEITSDYNLNMFKNQVIKHKEMDNTRNNIKGYMGKMEALGRDIENLDYFEGNEKYTALLTRFSKSSMGQVSNPNYYLKAATNSYFADKPYDINSYKALASVNSLTDLTEQKLLDFKSIKTKDDALGVATLASSYREAMDNIASGDKSISKNALAEMYTNLLKMTNLENEGPLILGYDKKVLDKNLEEAVEQAIQRILQGKHYRSNSGNSFTLEETLYNINTVLQDEKANDLFFSAYIRQNDIKTKGGKYLSEYEKNQRALNQVIDPNNKMARLINGYNYLDSTVDLNGRSLSVGESLYSLNDSNGIGEGIFKVSSIRRDGTNNFINLMDTDTNKITTINGSSFKALSEKVSRMSRYSEDIDVVGLLSNKYNNEVTSSLNGFFKIDSIISSSNTETVKYRAAMNAISGLNLDNLNDVLNTSAVLKDKGFINESDATKFIKNMNANIKESGASGYHDAKMQNLLGLKSLRQNAKVSSVSSLNSLLSNEITEESISKVRGSARISNIKDRVNSLSRVNIDKISALTKEKINETIKNSDGLSTANLQKTNLIRKDIMEQVTSHVAGKDKGVIRELKEIFSNNSEDLNFITDVLGLKLEEIQSLIENNEGSKAIDIINSSKISYGNYIGFNIGELEDSILNKIISAEYDTSGISSEVVDRTTKVIKYSQDLKNDGVIRKVKPTVLDNNIDESITNTIKDINEKIKNSDVNSDGLSGKSIVDKISDLGTKAKNNKKLLIGSLAVAGTAIAASYLYGNAKMNEKDEQYVAKNSNETYDEKIIKQDENGTNTNSRYYKVPDSNKKFYGNGNNGTTVNVSGRAKTGSNISNLNTLASRIFGGSSATVNTSISDSRKGVEDRDVDALMSQAVRF